MLLSSSGPQTSPLVAGTMTWGEWGADFDTGQMAHLIRHCYDLGITTFDQADIYGHYTTEEAFGQAFQAAGIPREKVQFVTKAGIRLKHKRRPANRLKSYDTTAEYLKASAEQSLKNLRTDYLDLFLIHRPDPLMDLGEVAGAVEELKSSGKIRHFGVSNFTPSQLAALNAHVEVATNQVEANPLRSQCLFDGTFDQALHLRFRPMIWSPLGGAKYFNGEGTGVLRLRNTVQELSAKYGNVGEDVILLAWLLRHPARPVPVIGTTKTERITRAVKAVNLTLDRQDWFAILEAGRGFEVA